MGVSDPNTPAEPTDPATLGYPSVPQEGPQPDPTPQPETPDSTSTTPTPEPDPGSPQESAPTADDLVAQHTKDTLVAAASVAGVEVAPGDTKADIAGNLVDAPAAGGTSEELVDQNKKSELVAAANVAGVDVASGDTKADIADKLVASATPEPEPESAPLPGPGDPGPATTLAQPVRVDNRTRRSDNDALEGLFCDVVAGPYAGRTGTFDRVLAFDRTTGYPKRILVITRDADNLMIDVAYEDARPSNSTGSRS